jgi:alpha-L-arabinofuranosidase
MAMKLGSISDAMSIKQKLEEKLAKEKEKIESDILKMNKKKFQSAYSDAEYIMNQTDMSYHSYVLDLSESGGSDFFDPQATIVMNTRYRPAQAYQFGFEEMFSYNSMAGGDMYVYKTLWGTK